MVEKNKNYGYLMVLASALMFGSYGVWSRLMGSAFDSFFQGWTRALIILILVVPIALWKKEIVRIKNEDWKWVGIFMVFTSLTQAPLYYAYTHISVGLTSLLFFVTMFLTMHMVGLFFFGEKATGVKIASSLIAVFGMYLVFSFTVSSFAMFAVMMAILGGVASGGEVAFSKKISDKYSPLYLTIISWVVVFISNCAISIAIGESQLMPALTFPWFWQLCYSVTSLFAFWIAIIGFKYVDVGVGAIIGLLEIVFSVSYGIIIFHETLSPRVAIGAVLIITAAALPHLVEIYRSKIAAK